MKIRTVSALLVFAAIASIIPIAHAQRSRSGRIRESSPNQAETSSSQIERRRSPSPPSTNLPTSPILPITNPVAPMTNPIMPFVRYGPVPEVVIPSNQPAPPAVPERRRRDRNTPVVVVGGGYFLNDGYYYPYYPYPQPYMNPAPVPGQLPNTYPSAEPTPAAVTPGAGAVPSTPIYVPEPVYYPEQNMIITPPVPERTVEPPAIGTSRADVLARYGQPWGSVRVQAKETLYFNGGLELVLEDGRVTQIR